jgi:hypothetical protein
MSERPRTPAIDAAVDAAVLRFTIDVGLMMVVGFSFMTSVLSLLLCQR